MQLFVSMCVIGSLICNQNDKLHVILTILFLQWCTKWSHTALQRKSSEYAVGISSGTL